LADLIDGVPYTLTSGNDHLGLTGAELRRGKFCSNTDQRRKGGAGWIGTLEAIEHDRRRVGEHESIPDEQHTALSEGYLAVVLPEEPRPLGYQQVSASRRVVYGFSHGCEYLPREIGIDARDQRCRDDGSGHHLVVLQGREFRLLEVEPHALTSAAMGKTQRAVSELFSQSIAEAATGAPYQDAAVTMPSMRQSLLG
jgi:hypothetical protein